jgi:hypothetical protein
MQRLQCGGISGHGRLALRLCCGAIHRFNNLIHKKTILKF